MGAFARVVVGGEMRAKMLARMGDYLRTVPPLGPFSPAMKPSHLSFMNAEF
jgi:hypothetical protein